MHASVHAHTSSCQARLLPVLNYGEVLLSSTCIICAVTARVWQLMINKFGILIILTMANGPATRRLLTELRELQSNTESRSHFVVEVDEEDI